jgi:hypothetical protein
MANSVAATDAELTAAAQKQCARAQRTVPPPSPIPTTGGRTMAINVPPDAPAGAPSGAPTASITSDHAGSDVDHVRTAILALQLYAEGNHDDQELAAIHKCIVALQNILASHAKDRDAALGTTPALRHVRRTTRGAGY